MDYIREYLFKTNWFNDWDEDNIHEETSYGLVMGENYADVMAKIERRLPYASNIEITEFGETDFVWMNKSHYERLKNGDEEMFDQEEEEEEIIKCGQPFSNPKDLWPHSHEDSLLKTIYGTDFDDECPYGLDVACQDCPDYDDCKFADGACDNDCDNCELNNICPNSLVDDYGPRKYSNPWKY